MQSVEVQFHAFVTLALEMSDQLHKQATLTWEKLFQYLLAGRLGEFQIQPGRLGEDGNNLSR